MQNDEKNHVFEDNLEQKISLSQLEKGLELIIFKFLETSSILFNGN